MSRKSRYRLSMVTEWRESTEPVCLGNWVSTAPRRSRHSVFMGKEKELKVCTRMSAVRQDSCESKTTQGLADQGEAFQLYSRSRGLADWLSPG